MVVISQVSFVQLQCVSWFRQVCHVTWLCLYCNGQLLLPELFLSAKSEEMRQTIGCSPGKQNTGPMFIAWVTVVQWTSGKFLSSKIAFYQPQKIFMLLCRCSTPLQREVPFPLTSAHFCTPNIHLIPPVVSMCCGIFVLHVACKKHISVLGIKKQMDYCVCIHQTNLCFPSSTQAKQQDGLLDEIIAFSTRRQ